MLAAGLVYCLASFLTYLALGFGILNFLKLFSGHHVLRNILEIGTIAVLFLLALFSLGDAIRFKASDRAQSMKLQLPDRLKMKMRQAMKRGLQYKFLLPGIFGIGVLVTVLESVCTGQIYIPTLVLVTRTNGIGIAFFYLLVYNIFFIIPLLLVFWMAYKGAAIMSLIRFSKRQAVLSKLTMSVFFVSLGIFMLFIRNI